MLDADAMQGRLHPDIQELLKHGQVINHLGVYNWTLRYVLCWTFASLLLLWWGIAEEDWSDVNTYECVEFRDRNQLLQQHSFLIAT